MDNEDVIRGQMEDTRTSLTDKLETLEQQVADGVHGATTNVAETVEAVKDSVQDTVTNVRETLTAVRESMRQSVSAVKGFFDIADHVEHYPWAVMGGAVVLGYVAGSLLSRSAGALRDNVSNERIPQHPPSPQTFPNGRHEAPAAEFSSSGSWLHSFAPEIGKLKGLALGALWAALQERIRKAVPPDIGSSLNEIFTSVTEKLTGAPRSRNPEPAISNAGCR
jgi:ElaB/YqjD/DUF883 family membrane-anchored ribosome-binding protein